MTEWGWFILWWGGRWQILLTNHVMWCQPSDQNTSVISRQARGLERPGKANVKFNSYFRSRKEKCSVYFKRHRINYLWSPGLGLCRHFLIVEHFTATTHYLLIRNYNSNHQDSKWMSPQIFLFYWHLTIRETSFENWIVNLSEVPHIDGPGQAIIKRPSPRPP